MRGKTIRVALPLALLGAAAVASAALPTAHRVQDPASALRRAQLEQELILAEGTATMYGDLERALRERQDGEESR